jgi:hypothetical protein
MYLNMNCDSSVYINVPQPLPFASHLKASSPKMKKPRSLQTLAILQVPYDTAPERIRPDVALAQHAATFGHCLGELLNLVYNEVDLHKVTAMITRAYDPLVLKGWEWDAEDSWTVEDYIIMHHRMLRDRSPQEREEYLGWILGKAMYFARGPMRKFHLDQIPGEVGLTTAFRDLADVDNDVVRALARIPFYLHQAIGI